MGWGWVGAQAEVTKAQWKDTLWCASLFVVSLLADAMGAVGAAPKEVTG